MRSFFSRALLSREFLGLIKTIVIVLSIFLFLFEFGFGADRDTEVLLDLLGFSLVVAAAIATLGGIIRERLHRSAPRKADILWLMVAIILILLRIIDDGLVGKGHHWPYLTFLGIFILIEISRIEVGRNARIFNPALLFAISFILLISIGTGLFMLPNAATKPIGMIDALFTATSAVCVTGLSVIDVQHDLTFMGKLVLMTLIQIGGLGVMTFTSFFAFFFKGRTSLEEQLRIRDFAQTSLVDARSFIIKVILFTLGVETIGAIFIYSSIDQASFSGFGDRLFFSVFHAISAFNNAGFSTWTNGLYEPPFRTNYSLLWIISFLLIFGGLGFGIIFNLTRWLKLWIIGWLRKLITGEPLRRNPWIISLSARLAIRVTLILIVLGTAAILVFEWDGQLAEHATWWGRFSTAFFHGVVPRTAGFNSVDMGMLSVPAIMATLILMYIGGSPGSTAGGIKTTTVAVAVLDVFAAARGQRRVEYAGREISNLSIRRAFATIVLSLIFLGAAITLASSLDRDAGLLPIAFECFSAYSTTGLSMNLTPNLSDGSRLVMVVLMFVGRVSALNLLVAVMRQITITRYHYPKEDILIN